MQYLKIMACGALASALIGCGGGGGSSGSGGATGGGSSADAKVAGYIYQLDKPALSNSGSDAVQLTVVALDVNNNPVSGATVKGSVDSGIFTPLGTVTDAAGKFVGAVSIGGDKTNRNITASITVSGVIKRVTIPVIGSQITITPVPATPSPGQSVRLDVRVLDALGAGIPGVAVVLSGTAGFSGTVESNLTGNLSVTAVAPTVGGSYVATAAGSGISASKSIQVVTPTGGNAIPDAVGVVNASSLTANPTSIATNTVGGTTNRAKLSAKFLAVGNAGIPNMRVRFHIAPPALGSGEFIASGAAFVYSDSAGLAETDYVAGTRTSPTNGVVVWACYDVKDFPTPTPGESVASGTPACPNSIVAKLTVNGQPLSISIGNHNKMTKGLGGIAYLEQFLIQVADSSGVAVKDARVTASVDITHFGKGKWGNRYPNDNQIPDITFKYGAPSYLWVVAVDDSSKLATFQTRGPYASNIFPDGFNNVWCVNEDLNRNGSLEAGEDINGTLALEPGKSEIALAFVNDNKTDANGQLLIQVSYPQNMGGWLAYTIKATTEVVGSEGTKERSFVTNVLKEDVENGSFLTPPYGSGRCIDPK